MPRGGKRKGTGRPKGSSESQEPTKTVRVPLSFAEKIPKLLKQHQEENSFEDLQIPSKVHEECLPLEKLTWDAFEVFCFDLIARSLHPQEIYRYGTQGDNQQGVDIVAHLNNGEKWAFQCKQWQRFNRSDAIKVIKQATEFEADRYILLLSRVASVEVRKVIADTPEWEVWDVHDISQKVRELPIEIARRLVRDHFHPEWQNAFLGISKLTPFVASEDFFHAWLDKNQLFNHTWELEGRNYVLTSLQDFVTSNENQVAILSGRGGIGKTKLLYEFSKEFKHSNFRLWFVEEGKPITPENVGSLSLDPCIIILDDAHQPEHEQSLKTLLSLMQERCRNQHPGIKLVISSRPHAIQFLKNQLDRKEINYLEIAELKELSRSDMKALARQTMGQEYTHFADQLALIARDSPLVTVIGGQLLAEQAISINLLERNEEFRRKVLNRFQEVLVGKISEEINPEICKKILELVAAVAPIQLTNEQFQQAASIFLGLKKSEFIRYIGILEKAGILLRKNNGLRITPDVLSDYILHQACVTPQGYLTGYAQEVFDHFKQICPKNVLSNLAELDWRIQCKNQEIDLLRDIWQKIRDDFQSSSHYGRCQILGILEEVAYNQPKQTLDLIKFTIQHPAKLAEPNYISFNTHEAVLKKLPALLHKISYTMDYLSDCCEILWKLGKDSKENHTSDPNHPIRILIDLAQYSLYKSVDFQQIVLKSVARWFRQSKTLNHISLLLDIIDPILQKDFEANYLEDWTFYFRKIPVSREKTQKLRNQSLDLITSCLKSDQVKVTLRALKSLFKALEQRIGRFAESPEDFSQEWGSEQLKILKIIDEFVVQNKNPLLHIEVNETLLWYANHGCIPSVKDKARNIINLIPDSYELKLTRLLIQKHNWSDPDDSQFIKRTPQAVANEFLQRYPNVGDGIKVLNDKLEEIKDSGFELIPYYLLEAIAEANPSYATSMCELLIQKSDLLLASHLTPLLSKIRFNNPELAIIFLQSALNQKKLPLVSAVARIYLDKSWAKNPYLEDINFIKKLINYPAFDIKRLAIMSLKKLGYFHPQLALDLALTVDIENTKELGSELCQLFMLNSGINPDILTNNHLEQLLVKFETITSIDDYWIDQFLSYVSKNFPDLVIQLLINRIKKDGENYKQKYQPLPYEELKYQFKLNDDAKSKEILRTIRDLSLNKKHAVRFSLPKLFQAILSSFTAPSLAILDEWINSEEIEKVLAVSSLLKFLPQSFIFTQVQFLANLLEQAYFLGENCYETVTNNLLISVTTGSRHGKLGEPFKEDIVLRAQSLAIASQFLIGSPAHKFYSSLADYAEAEIKRQVEFDKAQLD